MSSIGKQEKWTRSVQLIVDDRHITIWQYDGFAQYEYEIKSEHEGIVAQSNVSYGQSGYALYDALELVIERGI